jgi:tetratricopeptide (TPR) repeat protein
MNRERWQRIESIFHGALDKPATLRSAYLDEACAGDRALRDEVVAMLAQHDTDPDFLEPVVDMHALGSRLSAEGPGAESRELKAVRVGPYRIVREIGAGGMGVVYLAMHEGPDFERAVALKVIRRGLDTEDVLRRFQLERRILAALRHPNVANLVDAGQTEDGRPFFVMDFVEGVPIDDYCASRKLNVTERLKLIQQVCSAVQYAHNNLVVHRDLKPGNILVTQAGTPILLDFGIGKLLDPRETAGEVASTKTTARAFTPEYAAPEQIRGEPVSTATDVYGLGLLLYMLLAGRRPFSPENGFAYEKAVLDTEPPRPSSFGGRELAGDLDTIVLKALRKEPERRYTSVSAFADDLQRHLDGLPVRARADTFTYVAGKFVRRHRLLVAAATVAFISLVGATLFSRAQTREVTRERDKAVAVQTFLLEMFGASGGTGDTVSVRQLLDGQVALLPLAYANNAELRAQMHMVVAEGYDRLGAFAPAESLATEALKLRRATLRANHPDLATSISLLGWIQHERGKSKDGEVLLREALALWPRARPANPGLHARTLNDLGVIREASGAYDEAGDLYRQALTMRRALFGGENRAVAVTGSNLSVVLYRKGDYKGAVAQAESALAVMRHLAGPDHQRSTLIQGNLATFRVGMGDLNGAETEYRDLIERQTRVMGRKHPVTAVVVQGLATVLRNQRRYAEAETLLVETLASYEAAYGKEHARVANALMLLGSVRSALGRSAEARPLIERALAVHRKLRGEVHRDVANVMGVLATLEGDAGNLAAAERGHRQALAVWEKAMGAKHVETATARARLARVVHQRGRAGEAYALYKEAEAAMVAAGVTESSASLKLVRDQMAAALKDSIR